MKLILLATVLILTGCSSNRLVIEKEVPPRVSLPRNLRTIEIQNISGRDTENLQAALAQVLSQQTDFKVIYSQNTEELIDAKLRGNRNRQSYPQADLIIRGQAQESIERRIKDGFTQFAVTSRLYLQLIKADSGEVVLSDYFVGTSLSNIYLKNSNTTYDGFTDALFSARNVALDKFISQFTPQKKWEEIELIPYKETKKFDEVKNLISYGKLDIAKEKISDHIRNCSDDTEKGKAFFTLAVVESLLGNTDTAKANILKSNELYPSEVSMSYLANIEKGNTK